MLSHPRRFGWCTQVFVREKCPPIHCTYHPRHYRNHRPGRPSAGYLYLDGGCFVSARYLCDGVLTTVSATHGQEQLQDYSETTRQIVAADRLLITKCDLAGTQAVEQLQASLSQLNAHAAQTLVRRGQAPLDLLAGNGLYGHAHRQKISLPTWMASTQFTQEQR